jgi:hypothetical protein
MSTSQTAGATGANGVKRVPPLQIFLSLSVLACWILLYAAGLLMESVEERIVLAPHTMQKQTGTMKYWDLEQYKKQQKRGKPSTDEKSSGDGKASTVASSPNAEGSAKSEATPNSVAPSNTVPVVQPTPKDDKIVERILAEERSLPRSFFVALLIHTPTNMALLTLFAGCLGGCVSNIKYSMMTQEERDKLTTHESSILCENPLSATLRGFVIYLCLIAGLYVAVDDPFKDSTPGQYARLAGTLSLLAFIVGFDPSRIKTWLKMADSKESKPVS